MWNLISTISYGLGSLAFLILAVMLAAGWRGRLQGGLLLSACVASAIWATSAALYFHFQLPTPGVIQLLEVIRNGLWCAFLLRLIRMGLDPASEFAKFTRHVGRAIVAFSTLWVVLYLVPFRWLAALEVEASFSRSLFAGHIIFTVVGLALIEQLIRNASREYRWAIKFLCLGLGGMFAYDFYFYADALLFKRVNPELWAARGAILAVIAPLIGISAARNPHWSLHVFVSRGVVFHSATLMAAGFYLLMMAAGGYYIRAYGGGWGGVAQAVFVFSAVVLLIVMLFSGQVRASARVFLAKHFFAYVYDYREEWLRFSRMLSSGETERTLKERVILALAKLVESPGGLILLRDDMGEMRVEARWALQESGSGQALANSALADFFHNRGWVIDLDEYRRSPDLYGGIDMPPGLLDMPDAWLVVPLFHQEDLIGFVVLARSRAGMKFNWEVGDLVKTAARHAASYLAQESGARALLEARQFEAYNKIAAFVMHDLKNLVSQLSLVVSNAERHKRNPDFVDDAISTVGHAVDRLNHLLGQLRTGRRGSDNQLVELNGVLREAVASRANTAPVPIFESTVSEVLLMADRTDLVAVFCHLIQNAQDATPPNGRVAVKLHSEGQRAIVCIEDSGCGMNEEFIRDRLFRPFETTKGQAGMGIGVYESRELIRGVGGTIMVTSRPGVGTTFTLTLPVKTS